MSIKKDAATGRRSVEVEVEVEGTVEEAWQAIATGPGVGAWFAPTEFADGEIRTTLAPGMVVNAKQTAWDPPYRFTAEAPLGPNAPAIGTEWSVEGRDGGTCIVRVVHSLFADTDDWDNQLTGAESGWPGYFRVLKLYMHHFRGKACVDARAMGIAAEPASAVWARVLASPLPVNGTVEYQADNNILIRTASSLAAFFAMPMGPAQTMLIAVVYQYGSDLIDAQQLQGWAQRSTVGNANAT
jgi:hypothetical protein